MVFKLEDLLQSVYGYFSSSPKHHFEFIKLAKIVETKGLKAPQNVKTRWINMVTTLKRVGKEYKTLIVKMAADSGSMEETRTNLVNLCDIGTILGLLCTLPMLEFVNALMKFAHDKDVFVCDCIAVVKICQADLYKMYIDPTISFRPKFFLEFIDVVANTSQRITQDWVINLNDGIEHVAFHIIGQFHMVHYVDSLTSIHFAIIWEGFDQAITFVKVQCTVICDLLVIELERRFLDHELMNALGIIYGHDTSYNQIVNSFLWTIYP